MGLWGLSSGETRDEECRSCALYADITHLQPRLFSRLTGERRRGTEEEKVLVVASQRCDAAASAPCVILSVSLINEAQAPMSASHRDNADQYTMKARSGAPGSRPL